MKYRSVDDTRIYQFIEEVKNLNANNNIKGFESASDMAFCRCNLTIAYGLDEGWKKRSKLTTYSGVN